MKSDIRDIREPAGSTDRRRYLLILDDAIAWAKAVAFVQGPGKRRALRDYPRFVKEETTT